jgi:ABC-type multidrug transport system ATPase subunit/pSer/pThr/pTyr-binding forkhead associated (FHA) protein/ABC-type multidrug transport system permease subunit
VSTPPAPVGPEGGSQTATLVHDGRRIALPDTGLTIGRVPGNGLVLEDGAISRYHAEIRRAQGGWAVADLGSKNGTRVNGERLHDGERILRTGDAVAVGGHTLRFLAGTETAFVAPGGDGTAELPPRVVGLRSDTMRIGRDADNDLVLDDPNVSRQHAEVRRAGDGRHVLRDLSSRNGTRLNGRPVRTAPLAPGDVIGIGPYRLVFDGGTLLARDDRGAMRLDADHLVVRVGERRILADVSVSISPGELVGVIGESGAGKSTLLRALAGVSEPTAGEVTINGEPVAARRTDIGYVPQDEIVHERLTVREALTYAARLRLPHGSAAAEVRQVVAQAMEDLELTERADVRIGALSGGQRRRVGVATELLTRPGLLFLDEPTTGLDPGLEARLMGLLRRLADDTRAVVVTTHATRSLRLCDRLIVMGRGGLLCFDGSPDDALGFFGADAIEDIYALLQDERPEHWQARFAAAAAGDGDETEERRPAPASRTPRPQLAERVADARVLTQRYVRLLRRDPRNLLILLGQAPVLGLAIAGLFGADTFAPAGSPGDAAQLLFFLIVTVTWMGSIAAAREIIRERAVIGSERAVGVGLWPYLVSKVVVLAGLAGAQVGLLLVVALFLRPLHAATDVYVQLIAIAWVTAIAAVAMGLALSASVRSEEQATSLIPLALIPSLLFGGAIVPVATMTAPLKVVSDLVFAQWAYAGAGQVIGMNERIATRGGRARVFGPDFFDLPFGATLLILLAFVAVFLGLTMLLLRRRGG